MRKIPFCQAHPALDLIRFKAYNVFMENIAGKTALVVGGSGGIGRLFKTCRLRHRPDYSRFGRVGKIRRACKTVVGKSPRRKNHSAF